MFDKFIVLYTANYCLKVDYFFGISFLLDRGVKVEFWNLSKLLLNEKYPITNKPKGLVEKELSTMKELVLLIGQNQNALYATPIGFNRDTYSVCKVLSKYRVRLLYGNFGMIPYKDNVVKRENSEIQIKNSIRQFVQHIRLISITWIIRKALYKTALFKPAMYLLKSSKNADNFYKVDGSTEVILGSSADYLNFTLSQNCIKRNRPYIVFIDQNIAYHPENGTLIADRCHDPIGYFSKMNELFESLECSYSCDIVICAHPTSISYKNDNPFNGRSIVFGQTQEYVKGAIGVISHNSTALSFAVLGNKPIMLVTTNDIEQNMPYGAHIIHNFKNLLGCSFVNLDEFSDNECIEFEAIDVDKYSDYKNSFLSINPSRSNGEMILELFNDRNA